MDHGLLIFSGPDQMAQELAAQWLALRRKQPLLTVDVAQLAAAEQPLIPLLQLALRDAALTGAIAYLTGWDACLVEQETPPGVLRALLAHEQVVVAAGRAEWQPHGLTRDQPVLSLSFEHPDFAQRRQIWRHYLAEDAGAQQESHAQAGETLDVFEVAARFALTTGQIRDAVSTARNQAWLRGEPLQQSDLYAGARSHSSARLGDMARKITPRYDWDDIILPDDQIEILRELVATVQIGRASCRERVWISVGAVLVHKKSKM